MSTTNQIHSRDTTGVQSVFTFRDPKLTNNPDSKESSNSGNATNSAQATPRANSFETRVFSFPSKSPGVISESRPAWPKLGDKPGLGNTSGDVTNTGSSVSPPGHLHDNKWAQIIIRARQRQISGDCENLSPTWPVGASGDGTGAETSASSTAVADSEEKLAPQKLVEMWFSKKRPPKLDTDDSRTFDDKDAPSANVEVKSSAQETTGTKSSRLLGKADKSGKDKKQISLGKMLSKKEEKETEEDLEFKKQCRLELEKRLSECGFGIHAPAKERLCRDRKAKDLRKQKAKSFEAASQTELSCDGQDITQSSSYKNINTALSPSPNCSARISHDSGLETKGDVSLASMDTEGGFEYQPGSSKARSLPEDLIRQGGELKPPTGPGRFSTASLRPESSEAELEFQKPARRARSLLDTFRDFASKSLWKKPQRHLHSKHPKSPSTLDLITNDTISSQCGELGKDASASGVGKDSSSGQPSSEESKANVLNQNAVDRGNVLRSVVFYQNRFIVVDQAKPTTSKTSQLEKKVQNEENSDKNHNSSQDKHPVPTSQTDSCYNSKYLGVENNTSVQIDSTLKTSQSFNGTGNPQSKLSLPSSLEPHSYLSVGQSVTNCMKSESDQELDLYYNRVQKLPDVRTGRSQSADRTAQSHSNLKLVHSPSNGDPNCELELGDSSQNQKEQPSQRQNVKPETPISNRKSRDLTSTSCSRSKAKVYSSEHQHNKDANRRKSQPYNSEQVGQFLGSENIREDYTSPSRHRNTVNNQIEESKHNRNPGHRVRSRSAGNAASNDRLMRREYQTHVDSEAFGERGFHSALTTEDQYSLALDQYSLGLNSPTYNGDHHQDGGRKSKENTPRSAEYETSKALESGNNRKARPLSKETNPDRSHKTRSSHGDPEEYVPNPIDGKISRKQKHCQNTDSHTYNSCCDTDHTDYTKYQIQSKDERISHTEDDYDEYLASLPEKYIETFLSRNYVPEPKGYRQSRNVQFQEETDIRRCDASPSVKNFHKDGGSESNRDIIYTTTTSRHKGQGQANITTSRHKAQGQADSQRHSRQNYNSLEIDENYEWGVGVLDSHSSRALRSSSSNRSPNSNTNSTVNTHRSRDEEILSTETDGYRGNAYPFTDTQEGNQKTNRRVRTSPNPDRALRTPRSPHGYDKGDVFSISHRAKNRGDLDTPHTSDNHRTLHTQRVKETLDRENYQPREIRPHRSRKEYHPSSEDYMLSVWNNQVNLDDSPPSHEDYQPSIKDYQPRRKKHHTGQRE